MFSVNYIFLMNITYIFAIITCLGFLVVTAVTYGIEREREREGEIETETDRRTDILACE